MLLGTGKLKSNTRSDTQKHSWERARGSEVRRCVQARPSVSRRGGARANACERTGPAPQRSEAIFNQLASLAAADLIPEDTLIQSWSPGSAHA